MTFSSKLKSEIRDWKSTSFKPNDSTTSDPTGNLLAFSTSSSSTAVAAEAARADQSPSVGCSTPSDSVAHDGPTKVSKHVQLSDQVIAKDAYFGHLARIADTAHIEDSMILNEAYVYGDVSIRHSRICHVSTVGDHAEIDHSFTYNKSRVTGSSRVLEGSAIFHLAQVSDEAVLRGVKMFNHSKVSGKARVEQTKMTETSWVDGEALVDNCTLSGPTLITGNSIANGCKLESVVLCHGAKLENVNKGRKWYCGLEESGVKNLGKRLLFNGYVDKKVQEHLQLHDIAPYDAVGDASGDAGGEGGINNDEREAMERAEVFQAGEGSHTPLKSVILAMDSDGFPDSEDKAPPPSYTQGPGDLGDGDP